MEILTERKGARELCFRHLIMLAELTQSTLRHGNFESAKADAD